MEKIQRLFDMDTHAAEQRTHSHLDCDNYVVSIEIASSIMGCALGSGNGIPTEVFAIDLWKTRDVKRVPECDFTTHNSCSKKWSVGPSSFHSHRPTHPDGEE